jgi:hypothetical protein
VRDLEAVTDAAGLERFALFRHSQGGAIAVKYPVRHPERVLESSRTTGSVHGKTKCTRDDRHQR